MSEKHPIWRPSHPFPTVSVVIPTWNRASLVKRAIMSAVGQTVSPIEILVCDDGSTDNSEQVVGSIQSPLVRWLPGSHTGLAAMARNRGIAAAQGEWVAFLDSDDVWLPDKLEKQIAIGLEKDLPIVCGNAALVDLNGRVIGSLETHSAGTLSFDELLKGNLVISSSMIVKRDLLLTVGSFPVLPNSVEDYALWLRLAIYSNFAHIQEEVLHYSSHGDNAKKSASRNAWLLRCSALKDAYRWSLAEHAAYKHRREIGRALAIATAREALFPLEHLVRRCLRQ